MSTPQTQAHTPIPISASATKTPHFANSPAYISTPSAQAASSTPNQTQSKELSPQTFDIIAPLHELLSRILATSASPFQNTATSLGGGGGGALTAPGGLHAFPGSQPLEAKDVATEAASIRARIRRAREVCAEIEWGDRTLESLEEEEKELKTRIERMRRWVVEVVHEARPDITMHQTWRDPLLEIASGQERALTALARLHFAGANVTRAQLISRSAGARQ